jgi:dihydrofolate reductase
MHKQFDLVVACDLNRGIGIHNRLPWRIREDMKHFSSITSGSYRKPESGTNGAHPNAVIMGRKTWESIPDKSRPLPNRFNIVVTGQSNYAVPSGVVKCKSLDEALQSAANEQCADLFVIGGARIYEEAMAHPDCRRLYVTEILDSFECDVFFPMYKERFKLVSEEPIREENGTRYSFKVYEKTE